jgi:type II restriction/modification system DNA methylase subunit YeeA
MDLWEREKGTAPKRNESQLEEKFIRPMFRKLGIPFEVEESTSRTQRRPDYGFFESEDAARSAFERREEGGDFYKDAVAVADAKRWGRPLDTRGSGEHERDFENPSYQIHVYLQETPARWAVLTDGKKWRLYYGPTSHRLDSYYEIDLPTVLEKGDLEDFKYFYLFFRHGAFLEDSRGECFLDEVYDESNVFAQELGEGLQDNIYEAIKVLSEGFMQYPDNDLSEDDLDLIHDSSLIYLYRLIFVLYAESEGRDLLDTNNEIYEESYSLNSLKQDIAEELDSPNPKYRDWQDNLWDRLDELFKLIDQGSKSRGIPEEDLYIPAYNGGLFRTDPDEDDSVEAQFLANHQVGDAYLAEIIELLTRSQNGNGGGKIFVDYSSLDVRHLGSIYEGLLEYQLDVADEPLALEDGEYVPAGEGDEVIVEEGEVHLSTGSGERKSTGSYYTPEYVVEYIVENTLEPLVENCRKSALDKRGSYEGLAQAFADEVFDLKILDPAMGSGHFLTSTIDYLAREIIDAQEKQAAQQGIETVDEEHDINWARRQVAQRCIYGVDLNPLAVELAKVSLWLRTLAAEQPLAFLDHHLKTGNSLVGSDIEEIEELESDAGGGGQNATLADFGVARKGTIEQLMRIYQDFIAIENQELADVKEMEAKYDEFERNKLRQRLEAMANVHTAEEFGLDNLPSDAYERMAAAMEDDEEWGAIEQMQWFQDAQSWGEKDSYFHWRLEFPEVFYNIDGGSRDNPGFDGVIGNPPYVKIQNIPEQDKDYFSAEFEVAKERYDLYSLFVEQADKLSEDRVGLILPNKFFEARAGRPMRNYLKDTGTVDSIVDFNQNQVFEGATTYTCLLFLTENRESSVIRYGSIAEDPKDSLNSISWVDIDLKEEGDKWNLAGEAERKILSRVEDAGVDFEDIADQIQVGVQTSANKVFVLHNCDKKDGSIEGYSKALSERVTVEEDLTHPFVTDNEVSRYSFPSTDSRLIYPYTSEGELISENHLSQNYPETHRYLEENKADLESRGGENQVFESWYAHWCPRHPRKFERPKILVSQVVKQGESTYDSDGDVYFSSTVYSPVLKDEYEESELEVLGLLNSSLVWYYITQTGTVLRGGYYRYKTEYLEPIGVPLEKNTTELEETVSDVLSWTQEREAINTDILDYLGEYSKGQTVGELYMPPSDLSQSILAKTTDDYDNLRIGSVHIEESQRKLIVKASVRYKPENEEDYETDQWGYTETDPKPAMEFVGLDEKREALIREFVPRAVEEADGFADFRENATSTNSLINRLEELALPSIDDVEDGLERYLGVKSRADELDEKIENANKRIDAIVYELYGLTEEEVELIESSIND